MTGLLVVGSASAAVYAIGLGDIAKVVGVGWLVSKYGDQIDRAITGALGEREAAARGATKVVPIISLGRGAHIGAAQVVGNPENVAKVKAVVQVEGKFGNLGAKVLLPTTTDSPSGSPERAKGVGVSAVIEFKI
jgi:hypothetical protein